MSSHGGSRQGAGRPTLKRAAEKSPEELAIEAAVAERKRQREAEERADQIALEAARAKAKLEREERAAAEKKVWLQKKPPRASRKTAPRPVISVSFSTLEKPTRPCSAFGCPSTGMGGCFDLLVTNSHTERVAPVPPLQSTPKSIILNIEACFDFVACAAVRFAPRHTPILARFMHLFT